MLVGFVLEPRLLALGRSRGQPPEFAMGLCPLLMGGLGYPFATVGRVVTALPDDVRGLFVGCSALCNAVEFAALAVFTRRVFRPASGWVEAAIAIRISAFALLVPAEAVWPGRVASALKGPRVASGPCFGELYPWRYPTMSGVRMLAIAGVFALVCLFLPGAALASTKCQCNNRAIAISMDDGEAACDDACEELGGGKVWQPGDSGDDDSDAGTVDRDGQERREERREGAPH